MDNKETVRLVKVVLESGFASRRKCEIAIESGRVRVNNEVIIDPAYQVKKEDSVSIDRSIIEREDKKYIALYKPKGVVCTTKYLPGRRIITDFFKNVKERLFYAGRLDAESRGIMIITNDGEFANIITHPSYEILKVYDVTVEAKVDSNAVLKASKGITIRSVSYSPFKFTILSRGRIQSRIRITINEGKNREIRNIFEYLGYKVIDLERISVGSVTKFNPSEGTLEAGHIRELTEEEINFFFNQKENKLKELGKSFEINTDKEETVKSKENNRNILDTKKSKLTKTHNKSKWAKAKPKKKRIGVSKMKPKKDKKSLGRRDRY